MRSGAIQAAPVKAAGSDQDEHAANVAEHQIIGGAVGEPQQTIGGVSPCSLYSVTRLPIASALRYIHFWKLVASFNAIVIPE